MRRGFTLVELMIAVAIIAILAAIAVPAVSQYQLKTKRSELLLVVGGMLDASIAYEAANDTFFDAGPCPPGFPGKQKLDWSACATADAWKEFGYEPDGDTYGLYDFGGPDINSGVALIGIQDLDGNVAVTTIWSKACAGVNSAWGNCPSLPGSGTTGPYYESGPNDF